MVLAQRGSASSSRHPFTSIPETGQRQPLLEAPEPMTKPTDLQKHQLYRLGKGHMRLGQQAAAVAPAVPPPFPEL